MSFGMSDSGGALIKWMALLFWLELPRCLGRASMNCLQLVKEGWALPSRTNRTFPQVGG